MQSFMQRHNEKWVRRVEAAKRASAVDDAIDAATSAHQEHEKSHFREHLGCEFCIQRSLDEDIARREAALYPNHRS